MWGLENGSPYRAWAVWATWRSRLPLLKRDAALCRVGVGKLTEPNDFGQMMLVGARNAITGSNTGGMRETQEMIDFCALHKIRPEITKIPMSGINEAWSKFVARQARCRFVMDMNVSQAKASA